MIEIIDSPIIIADRDILYPLPAQRSAEDIRDDLDELTTATEEAFVLNPEDIVERLNNLYTATLCGDMDIVIGTANGISAFGDTQANVLDMGYVTWRDSQPDDTHELSREESGRTLDVRVEDGRRLVIKRHRPLARKKLNDRYIGTIVKETEFCVPLHAGLELLGFLMQPDGQRAATTLSIAEDWIDGHEKYVDYFSIQPIETRFTYELRQEEIVQALYITPLGAIALHSTQLSV